MKQTAKRRDRNVIAKRNIKSAVKAFLAQPSATGLSQAQSEIDTAVKKNLLKKATASRRKANLAKIAKTAGVTLTTSRKESAKTAKKPATPSTGKTSSGRAPAKATAKKPAVKATVKKPAVKKTTK